MFALRRGCPGFVSSVPHGHVPRGPPMQLPWPKFYSRRSRMTAIQLDVVIKESTLEFLEAPTSGTSVGHDNRDLRSHADVASEDAPRSALARYTLRMDTRSPAAAPARLHLVSKRILKPLGHCGLPRVLRAVRAFRVATVAPKVCRPSGLHLYSQVRQSASPARRASTSLLLDARRSCAWRA